MVRVKKKEKLYMRAESMRRKCQGEWGRPARRLLLDLDADALKKRERERGKRNVEEG